MRILLKYLFHPKILIVLGVGYLSVKLSTSIIKANNFNADGTLIGLAVATVILILFSSFFRDLLSKVLAVLVVAPVFFGLFLSIIDYFSLKLGFYEKSILYLGSLGLALGTVNKGIPLLKYLIVSSFKKAKNRFKNNFNKLLYKLKIKTKCPIDKSLEEIDTFGNGDSYEKGRIFEEYIAEVFRTYGYNAYTTTQMRQEGRLPPSIQKRGGSGEQGVDVIVEIPDQIGTIQLLAVQCKHYSNKVDNKAVQEITAALSLYGAKEGMVITNNLFTGPAWELAKSNKITLIDRHQLVKFIDGAKKEFKKVS